MGRDIETKNTLDHTIAYRVHKKKKTYLSLRDRRNRDPEPVSCRVGLTGLEDDGPAEEY